MTHHQSNIRCSLLRRSMALAFVALAMIPILVSSAMGKDGDKNTKVHHLSTYRFLVGGSWVHLTSGPTDGKATAALFMRTRLYDSRGKLGNIGMSLADAADPERSFVDLMVDAYFTTSRAFNEITWTESNEVASVFLTETRSSKVSMAFYYVPDINLGLVKALTRYADYGVIGPFMRFSISTQDGSADIFRRFVFGVRLENRSKYSIRGASAEVGFTVDNAPGSMQTKKKSLFGTDRIVLNFELPISGKSGNGLYAQFHGEWPLTIADKDQLILEDGSVEDISPPIYEFRLGMTFDPARMFGFLL